MAILAQFLLRLCFGLAAGMLFISPRLVTSGYFRNNLYVTLGLATMSALLTYAAIPDAFWYAIGAAAASYIGSVLWLYEKHDGGRAMLGLVALLSFIATSAELPNHSDSLDADRYFPVVDHNLSEAEASRMEYQTKFMGYASGALFVVSNITSALLLGITTAAMLLGHWYLNSPGMQLAPLKRLLMAMGVTVLLQTLVSATALICEVRFANEFSTRLLIFLLLRWSFGLVAVAALTGMAWKTIEIPNTQSATGILYVAVIGVFVGELTGLLLSAESAFPL